MSDLHVCQVGGIGKIWPSNVYESAPLQHLGVIRTHLHSEEPSWVLQHERVKRGQGEFRGSAFDRIGSQRTLVDILVKMLDSSSVETGRSTNDTVDLVSLG